jgi:hypothetical protein
VASAALLLREIRARVPLCEDLVGEIIRRNEKRAALRPLLRRRGRGRAERAE